MNGKKTALKKILAYLLKQDDSVSFESIFKKSGLYKYESDFLSFYKDYQNKVIIGHKNMPKSKIIKEKINNVKKALLSTFDIIDDLIEKHALIFVEDNSTNTMHPITNCQTEIKTTAYIQNKLNKYTNGFFIVPYKLHEFKRRGYMTEENFSNYQTRRLSWIAIFISIFSIISNIYISYSVPVAVKNVPDTNSEYLRIQIENPVQILGEKETEVTAEPQTQEIDESKNVLEQTLEEK